MHLRKENFRNISIFGRMAFGMRCVEENVGKFSNDIQNWSIVFDQMWSFREAEFIDEWWYHFTEILPDIVLDKSSNNSSKDYEYITQSEFNQLHNLYSSASGIKEINTLMNLVHEICSVELYTQTHHPAPNSLKVVGDLLNYLRHNKLESPPIIEFEKYTMESGCWGKATVV